MVSHMTVARRLTKLRRRGLDGSGIGLDRRPSYKSLVHNKETYFAIGTPLDRLRANGLNPFMVSLLNHQPVAE
jgi:hypothetical protein